MVCKICGEDKFFCICHDICECCGEYSSQCNCNRDNDDSNSSLDAFDKKEE